MARLPSDSHFLRSVSGNKQFIVKVGKPEQYRLHYFTKVTKLLRSYGLQRKSI